MSCLLWEQSLKMAFKERNWVFDAEIVAEWFDQRSILDDCWIAVFYLNSIRQFRSYPFNFPENWFVSRNNFFCVVRHRTKIIRNRHIKNRLEKQNPRVKRVLLHKVGTYLQLVANVEHFAYQMHHVQGVGVIAIVDHIIYKVAQLFERTLDDFEKWFSVLV